MTVSIHSHPEGSGVRVDDRIERRRCELETPEPVDPVPIEQPQFRHPVDAAALVRTDELTLPQVPSALVRDEDGTPVADIDHFSDHELPEGRYTVELSAAVKLYLDVAGPLVVDAGAIQVTLSFDGERQVRIGARSYHERPAATITTTSDAYDVMRAVSYLGSALKTTTPDRSYPTLRGHPPGIELGDALAVPDELERPRTGIRIEVPPTLATAFVVAPLSYYLGAEVVPGEDPRIVTDAGFEFSLAGSFEEQVERVLKRTFLLDCLARTERSAVDLRERRVVEDRIDLDFGAVAGLDAAGRLAAYLDVPYGAVADAVPSWKLTAHVEATPDSIETIPFLVDDLAVVRTPARTDVSAADVRRTAIGEFVRSPEDSGVRATRGTPAADPPEERSFVEPGETDAIEQAWVGEGIPVGASKAITQAYRNRLDRQESGGDVDVVVVCNDEEMLEERDVAAEVYGSREELPFEVTLYENLSHDRLRFVLESDIDFLHYVGHIDAEGFECADGKLDARDLDAVGVDAFFLNACSSYEQGVELIERGAVGGVVTLDDVINSGALRVGKTMARLLNLGFPLRPALTIAKERSIVGGQYLVVGDGSIYIAHFDGLVPDYCEVESDGTDYELSVMTYPVSDVGAGGLYRPNVGANEEQFLVGSTFMEFTVDESELSEFFELGDGPVRIDGEFTWCSEVDPTDL